MVDVHLGEGEPAAGPWRVAPLTELVRRLLATAGDPPGRPRVVAVDGRSAGGKTTLAARLQGAVPGSAVVHTDDIAWHESFFGWEQLMIDGVLRPLHRGEPVCFRPPAWERRGRPGAVELPGGPGLVVVEGVGAARRELRDWLDAVVWLQSDVVEAERRGLVRDGGEEAHGAFWREWWAQEVPFQAEHRPWDRADVIVCGTPELAHDPVTEVVLAAGH